MKRALWAAGLLLGLGSSPLARAEWSVSGDLEHFRWKESTSPGVTETGPISGIGLRWTQDRPAGWTFGYHGRLYFGSVDYDGSLLFSGAPVQGTTEYTGMTHEGQAVYRVPGSAAGAGLVLGLGYDYWNRELTAFQREEYQVLFLRLGGAFDRHESAGWYGGAGLKYPFWIEEDAHFPDLGFVPNPRLSPKGRLGPYAELGYRFNRRWQMSAYYESYRFAESGDVSVIERGTGTPFSFFQPKSSADMLGLRMHYSFQP